MYFVSRIYQSLKIVVATFGLTGSVIAIVYGSLMSGGAVFIVGGSLCLVNSLFNFGESGKVINDIKKQISKLKDNLTVFSKENFKLKENVEEFSKLRDEFVKRNIILQQTLEETVNQISQLDKVQSELRVNLNDQKLQINFLKDENNELNKSLDKFQEENEKLQHMIQSANQQLLHIEHLKTQYETENQKLSENNEELGLQIKKQSKIIEESKKLIKTLAQFGDSYNDFSATLDQNVIKLDHTQGNLEQTAIVLEKLVDRLKGQKFEDMDLNNDGKISQDEFNHAL